MNTDLKVIKNEKYGFFNKIYYSIFKPSKYSKMAEFGLKKACYYLVILMAMVSIILTGLATYNVNNIISSGKEYINNNIADDVILKNYELTSENEIILTNTEITDIFSYSIIANSDISKEEAEEKYKDLDSDYDLAILLKDEFLIMDIDTKEFYEYQYSESLQNFGIETDKEYNKNDVISYFDSISPAAYIIQYFSLYFITYFIVFMIIAIILAVIGGIIKKLLKKNMSKHELAEYAIYSLTPATLLFLVYLILNFFTNITVNYLEIIILIISAVFMFVAIKNKEENEISKSNDKLEIEDEEKNISENDDLEKDNSENSNQEKTDK